MTALRRRIRLRGERGFTLVELIVVMPMLLVLLLGLIAMVTTTMKWNSRTQEQSTLQTEARGTVATFVADVRQAYLGSGPAIASANATAITFYSPDKQASFHLRQISYRLFNGTLQRSVALSTNAYPSGPPWTFGATSQWSTQVGSVTNATPFTYYDGNGNVLSPPIADLSQIRSVAIALTVTTGGSQAQVSSFGDTATLRGTE